MAEEKNELNRRLLQAAENDDLPALQAALKAGADVNATDVSDIDCSALMIAARKGNMLEVVVTDGTSKLSLTFFNQAWRERDLKVGRQGLFAGKVGLFNGKR
jgi:RecG-like helicase